MTVFDKYDDLPESTQAYLLKLELFIGDLDGKTVGIATDDETFIDDGTVDADDAVIAFNEIVKQFREITP